MDYAKLAGMLPTLLSSDTTGESLLKAHTETVKRKYNSLLAAAKGLKQAPDFELPVESASTPDMTQAKLASSYTERAAQRATRTALNLPYSDPVRAATRVVMDHPATTVGTLALAILAHRALKRRQLQQQQEQLTADYAAFNTPTAGIPVLPSLPELKQAADFVDMLSHFDKEAMDLFGVNQIQNAKRIAPALVEALTLAPIHIPMYVLSGLIAEKVRRAVLPPLPTTIQVQVVDPNNKTKSKKYKPLIITDASLAPHTQPTTVV